MGSAGRFTQGRRIVPFESVRNVAGSGPPTGLMKYTVTSEAGLPFGPTNCSVRGTDLPGADILTVFRPPPLGNASAPSTTWSASTAQMKTHLPPRLTATSTDGVDAFCPTTAIDPKFYSSVSRSRTPPIAGYDVSLTHGWRPFGGGIRPSATGSAASAARCRKTSPESTGTSRNNVAAF